MYTDLTNNEEDDKMKSAAAFCYGAPRAASRYPNEATRRYCALRVLDGALTLFTALGIVCILFFLVTL